MPYMNNKLVQQLEIYRLTNKITQEKLADMLGVDFTTVNRWFNAKTQPGKIQTFHIEKLIKRGRKNVKR